MGLAIAERKKLVLFLGSVLTVLCFCSHFCSCTDTISSAQSVKDSEYVFSNGKIFKLGFFSPPNSTSRYVGIMYNMSVTSVIWVANRDQPLNDSSGILTISEDGNLVVLNGQKETIWSSNVSSSVANSSAQLLDSGNLVLTDSSNDRVWESFEHPSNSFVQRMPVTSDGKTGKKIRITSWKSPSDPSVGSFSAGVNSLEMPQLFVWNGSSPYWRSGPWNGQVFLGIPDMGSLYMNGFDINDDKRGTVSVSFSYENQSVAVYFVLTSLGVFEERYKWYSGEEDWEVTWSSLRNECDLYGKCGPFGSCNPQDSRICSCLIGFEPKNEEEWGRGNWTSGCKRRTPLKCERNNTDGGGGKVKDDGFLKLKKIKVPDFAWWVAALEEDCRIGCLSDCSCVAYAFNNGIGCMQWNGSLIDLQQFSIDGFDSDLFIRVAYPELGKEKNIAVVLAVALCLGTVAIVVCTYFSWRWMVKRHEIMPKDDQTLLSKDEVEVSPWYSTEFLPLDRLKQIKLQELPLFNFKLVANATENFKADNKLGMGGFGTVYKGRLQNGQEIAVKRLSRSSHQGLQEFVNEVMVISKLQHRNLVRLLGCCVEAEEKMLVYEYLPNRSLDVYLFDSHKQELLDWRKRASIIEGISRGLLYLHRDSRLRIIHRDLKASNILLDEHLNPKISDFGTAKIFGGNQDQDNTKRVVGTYGYMAPEYAMRGIFSEKSDVYSFGVLLLEIVSGRSNTGFHADESSSSLLGFAWKLWNEGNMVQLVSPTFFDPGFWVDMLRCIHVGLLCVQESPEDRPSISSVLSILSSETTDLPAPKQPAFTERQTPSKAPPCQQSINNVTLTMIGGR